MDQDIKAARTTQIKTFMKEVFKNYFKKWQEGIRSEEYSEWVNDVYFIVTILKLKCSPHFYPISITSLNCDPNPVSKVVFISFFDDKKLGFR